MANLTVVFGLLLTALGLYGRFGTGTTSNTALIPAAIGAVFVLCGLIALISDATRKHAMHLAAMVGLLSFLGCAAMALPKVSTLVNEGKVTRIKEGVESDATFAVESQLITGGLSAVFVGLCIKSFIDARRRRQAAEAATAP